MWTHYQEFSDFVVVATEFEKAMFGKNLILVMKICE